MSTPKYTFLLPAYKGKFLDEMLQSIQSQTYKDFKVIISDDCSPEDLKSICEPYLQDPRFKYRRNEKNMGGVNLVDHWNLLVGLCDTEWFIMASDDDIYDEHFLEEVDVLTKCYSTTNFIRSKACRIDEKSNILTYEGEYKEYVNEIEFAAEMHMGLFTMCMANAVFRTEALLKIGGYKKFPWAMFTDTATMLLMANNGCVNTKRELFYFRISDYNISNQIGQNARRAVQKVEAALSYDTWMRDWMKEHMIVNDSYTKFLLNYTKDQHHGRTGDILWNDYYWCSLYNVIRYYSRICRANYGSRYRLLKVLLRKR